MPEPQSTLFESCCVPWSAMGRESAQVCYSAPYVVQRLVPAAPLAVLSFVVGLGGACRPATPPPSASDSSSSGTTGTDAPVGTTFAGPAPCQSSDECETDGTCVAPYDPGSDPPMGQGGCVAACIEPDDLSRWCFDDEGCCADARCHEIDGLCEARDAGTSSDTGSSSGTGSTSTGSSTSTSTTSTGSTSTGSTGSTSTTGSSTSTG